MKKSRKQAEPRAEPQAEFQVAEIIRKLREEVAALEEERKRLHSELELELEKNRAAEQALLRLKEQLVDPPGIFEDFKAKIEEMSFPKPGAMKKRRINYLTLRINQITSNIDKFANLSHVSRLPLVESKSNQLWEKKYIFLDRDFERLSDSTVETCLRPSAKSRNFGTKSTNWFIQICWYLTSGLSWLTIVIPKEFREDNELLTAATSYLKWVSVANSKSSTFLNKEDSYRIHVWGLLLDAFLGLLRFDGTVKVMRSEVHQNSSKPLSQVSDDRNSTPPESTKFDIKKVDLSVLLQDNQGAAIGEVYQHEESLSTHSNEKKPRSKESAENLQLHV